MPVPNTLIEWLLFLQFAIDELGQQGVLSHQVLHHQFDAGTLLDIGPLVGEKMREQQVANLHAVTCRGEARLQFRPFGDWRLPYGS
jgi:hypothetical protein